MTTKDLAPGSGRILAGGEPVPLADVLDDLLGVVSVLSWSRLRNGGLLCESTTGATYVVLPSMEVPGSFVVGGARSRRQFYVGRFALVSDAVEAVAVYDSALVRSSHA